MRARFYLVRNFLPTFRALNQSHWNILPCVSNLDTLFYFSHVWGKVDAPPFAYVGRLFFIQNPAMAAVLTEAYFLHDSYMYGAKSMTVPQYFLRQGGGTFMPDAPRCVFIRPIYTRNFGKHKRFFLFVSVFFFWAQKF